MAGGNPAIPYRKDNVFYTEVRGLLGEGLLTSQDERWRAQQRLLQPLFTRRRLASYVPLMADEAQHLASRWRVLAARGASVGMEIETTSSPCCLQRAASAGRVSRTATSASRCSSSSSPATTPRGLALAYALHLLGRHPAVQQRARREAQDVPGDEHPGPEIVARLPYTAMVLTEELRLYPPVYGFGRRLTHDARIGRYAIAPGTDVLICPWVTHRHPAFWPDPGSSIPSASLRPARPHSTPTPTSLRRRPARLHRVDVTRFGGHVAAGLGSLLLDHLL